MSKKILSTFLIAFLFLALACQTNQARQFERIHDGMDKGEVLELMGSPQSTKRSHGVDRWTYKFPLDSNLTEKEVQFENGHVIYFGDHPVPAMTADQKDEAHEKENAQLEKELKEKKEQLKQDIEKHETPDESNQIRYVPQFEPIN